MELKIVDTVNQVLTYDTYKEVNDSILILELNINRLKDEVRRLIVLSGPKPVQAQSYDINGGGSKSTKVEDVNYLYNLIDEKLKEKLKLEVQLEELKEKKEKIENNFIVTCLNEIEKKVFKLKGRIKTDGTRFTYREIACKLGREEGTIKNIIYTINKKQEEWLRNVKNISIIFQNNDFS